MRLPRPDFNRTNITVSSILSLLYALAAVYCRCGFDLSVPLQVLLFVVRAAVSFLFVMYIMIPGTETAASRAFAVDRPGPSGVFWKNALLFALIWLPFLLIKYPAAVHPDTWQGIHQFLHSSMKVHQPVAFVVLTGEFIKRLSPDTGIFAVSLLGYLSLTLSMGYALTYADSMNIKKVTRYILIFLLAFSPFTLGYIGVAVKDVFFSSAMVIFVLVLMQISDGSRITGLMASLLFLSSAAVYLFRPNGPYILIITVLFLALSALRKKGSIKTVVIIAAAIAAGFCVNTILISAYNVSKPENSAKEALSIPFQQTARLARDYPSDITEEERKIINEVLPYDTLADNYDPRISDPVKETYTGNNDALRPYFRVWFDQFLRHPICCLDAFLEQNHYLFSPVESSKNIAFYEDTVVFYELDGKYDSTSSWMYEPLFTSPGILSVPRSVVTGYCFASLSLPVIWITSNVGICNLLLIFCLLMSLAGRRKGMICYVPLLTVILIAMAGPAIQGQPRYLFPVMYLIPIIVIRYLRSINRQ